jgi:hypothetical protein
MSNSLRWAVRGVSSLWLALLAGFLWVLPVAAAPLPADVSKLLDDPKVCWERDTLSRSSEGAILSGKELLAEELELKDSEKPGTIRASVDRSTPGDTFIDVYKSYLDGAIRRRTRILYRKVPCPYFVEPPSLAGTPYFEFGIGVGSNAIHSTSDFFGPGTGSGAEANDNSFAQNFQFDFQGVQPFTPNLAGAFVVKLITPALNAPTNSRVTSNGIPVSFRVGQSGLAVELEGRIYVILPSDILPVPPGTEFFFGGGGRWGDYTETTSAPTVGDNFSGSKFIFSPTIDAGIQVPLCPVLNASPLPNGLCPVNGFFEFEHGFNNTSFPTGTTFLSSSTVKIGDFNEITAGIRVLLNFSNVPPEKSLFKRVP